MSNFEVIKHSAAIHISNTLTRNQRAISNILLKNAFNDLLTKTTHKIKISDLKLAVSENAKTRNTQALREIFQVLVTTKLEWNVLGKDNKNEWGVSTLLSGAKIKNGICEYEYGHHLRTILSSPNIYARLNLLVQRQFKKGHTIAVWEYLVEFLCSKGYQVGYTDWLAIEAFRKLLGVHKDPYYNEFKNVNRRLIKESLKEINLYSEIEATVEYKKESRRVIAVRFKVSKKECYQPPLDFRLPNSIENTIPIVNVIDNSKTYERLMSVGLSDKQAVSILKNNNESYINDQLYETENRFKKGKIQKDKLVPYVMAVFRDPQPRTSLDIQVVKEKMEQEKAQEIAKQKKQKIDDMLKAFEDEFDKNINKVIKTLNKSTGKKHFLELKDQIDEPLALREYLNRGLDSLIVRINFEQYLAKLYLKPHEYDFVKWGGQKGFSFKKVKNEMGKEVFEMV